MWSFIKRIWNTLRRPSAYFSLGFLTVGGFLAGIVFWGGFNTAMELTNTETFCVGCHEMRANVLPELQPTIHFPRLTPAHPHSIGWFFGAGWEYLLARALEPRSHRDRGRVRPRALIRIGQPRG